MADYTNLNGFDDLKDATLNNEIQDNLIEFFDWGLLEKGNYFNINIPTSGVYGGDKHRLRLVDDPNYTYGQVWEGFRENWVWQSGVSYSPAPLVSEDNVNPGVSGVYVGGAFYPTTTVGSYAHHVNHHYGRVVFDSAIATDSIVTAEYSYKWVNIVYADNVPWLREIQYNSRRIDNSEFLSEKKGDWDQLAQTRFQLPAIAIEIVPRRSFVGYQLGGGQIVYTDVLFHIMAEEEYMRNKLIDVITFQNEKTIFSYGSNLLSKDNNYPIDYRGVPNSGALRYPELVRTTSEGGYRNNRIRFSSMTSQDMTTVHPNLYTAIVRCRTEVILGGI